MPKISNLLYFVAMTIFLLTTACQEKHHHDPDPEPPSEPLAGGDFEQWTTVTQGSVSYQIPAGNWWDCLNTLAILGGPVTVSKTTDAYSGNYAAMLETKKWGDQLTIPGILVSGRFDSSLPIGQNLVIGQPFNKRPGHFTGYYKYQPAGQDSMIILIALTRYNALAKQRDTIAQNSLVVGNSSVNYQRFNLELTYQNPSLPDSIHIIFLSSIKGQHMQGQEGSVLKIDALSLVYD